MEISWCYNCDTSLAGQSESGKLSFCSKDCWNNHTENNGLPDSVAHMDGLYANEELFGAYKDV